MTERRRRHIIFKGALAIRIVREDNRSAEEDEDKNKPGNKKDTQRQTIDTQHQKLKTHETHGPRTHGYLTSALH
jgi:hypothetical protein